MGRLPSHIIFKRVAKGYAKSFINTKLRYVDNLDSQLSRCWEIYGEGSRECATLELEYKQAVSYSKEYKNMMESKDLGRHALKYLAPIETKCQKKGRDRFRHFNIVPSRFRQSNDLNFPIKTGLD